MIKNDGGTAFPVSEKHDRDCHNSGWGSVGISVRDYFAAKAMQGILFDNMTTAAFDRAGASELVQPAALVATAAYAMADAMLKAREQ